MNRTTDCDNGHKAQRLLCLIREEDMRLLKAALVFIDDAVYRTLRSFDCGILIQTLLEEHRKEEGDSIAR